MKNNDNSNSSADTNNKEDLFKKHFRLRTKDELEKEYTPTSGNPKRNMDKPPSIADPIVNSPEKHGMVTVDFSEDTDSKKTASKIRKILNFSLIKFFGIIVLIVVVVSCLFGVWNRWFRYDDSLDLISKWQISHTDSFVTIDKNTINLGPNSVYEYTLDTNAKVIYYTIGNMKGQSHYRFSWDRCQVAFLEDTSMDWFSTCMSDLKWFFDWATCAISGIELSPSYTKENLTDVDTDNTGLDDIIYSDQGNTILLDKVATHKTDQ